MKDEDDLPLEPGETVESQIAKLRREIATERDAAVCGRLRQWIYDLGGDPP